MNKLEFITENGEITFNKETKKYVVWDETYTIEVCITPYKELAEKSFLWYSQKFLK